VLLVEKRRDSSEETAQIISDVADAASVRGAVITWEENYQLIARSCVNRDCGIDILHNNVGCQQATSRTYFVVRGDAVFPACWTANFERSEAIPAFGVVRWDAE